MQRYIKIEGTRIVSIDYCSDTNMTGLYKHKNNTTGKCSNENLFDIFMYYMYYSSIIILHCMSVLNAISAFTAGKVLFDPF